MTAPTKDEARLQAYRDMARNLPRIAQSLETARRAIAEALDICAHTDLGLYEDTLGHHFDRFGEVENGAAFTQRDRK